MKQEDIDVAVNELVKLEKYSSIFSPEMFEEKMSTHPFRVARDSQGTYWRWNEKFRQFEFKNNQTRRWVVGSLEDVKNLDYFKWMN